MTNSSTLKAAIDCLHQIIDEGRKYKLKYLLREIEDDYDNPCLEYILKHCKNYKDFEDLLKDYSHLFLIENGKIAKFSYELESGQENVDKYCEEKLKVNSEPVHILEFRKYIGKL